VNWRPFVGLEYVPPFGCFDLVRRALSEGLGHAAPELRGDTDHPLARAAAFRDAVARHCRRIAEPAEGDVIIFASGPVVLHCGLVVRPARRLMLHANFGPSVVEPWDGPEWRDLLTGSDVAGFYRYG
jgi:hypothetical protein